jgi:hypothetical protein
MSASGRCQCSHDATHSAPTAQHRVYACPEHVTEHPELPWVPLAAGPIDSPALKAARLAAAALTMALATERAAAAEVGGTDRRARLLLDTDRQSAAVALGALAALLPPHRVAEVAAMADGAARGYAIAPWGLRALALASEVTRG